MRSQHVVPKLQGVIEIKACRLEDALRAFVEPPPFTTEGGVVVLDAEALLGHAIQR